MTYTHYSVSNPSLVAQTVKNPPTVWETQIRSLHQEDPQEKEMLHHSSILAWKFHGQRSLVGDSSSGHKELDTTGRLYILFMYKIDKSSECTVYHGEPYSIRCGDLNVKEI